MRISSKDVLRLPSKDCLMVSEKSGAEQVLVEPGGIAVLSEDTPCNSMDRVGPI